jgi:hypothetical protein
MARVTFVPGWEKKLDNAIQDFMQDLADDVLDDMRRHCPVDTGRLLADLGDEVHGGYARIGAATVPYAIYAEEGTHPHMIEPNSADALYWEGAAHPVNEVFHPGYEGSHFMKRALYKKRGV